MLCPTGKGRRAYDRGVEDRRKGREKADNPYLIHPVKSLASWWIAGFNNAGKGGGAK